MNNDISILDGSVVDDGDYNIFSDDDNFNILELNAFGNPNTDQNNINNMKNTKKKCFVCETENIDFFYNCGNGVCNLCFNEHLKAQISKYKSKVLSDKIIFVCTGPCRCKVADNNEMESLMSAEVKKFYHEILLLMTLNKSKDVLACPNSNCTNYGFYDAECAKCVNPEFTCNFCGFKWVENKGEKDKSFFENYLGYLTSIRKFITTKSCFKCKSPIEKAEGCKHIECNRCDYAFCWDCNIRWDIHKETECLGLFQKTAFEEDNRPDFYVIFILLIVVIIATKIIFSFNIIFNIIYFLMRVVILISIFAGKTKLILYFTDMYLKKRKKVYLNLFLVNILIEIIILYRSLYPFSSMIYRLTNLSFIELVMVMFLYKMIKSKKNSVHTQ